jgi:hypothetical protein
VTGFRSGSGTVSSDAGAPAKLGPVSVLLCGDRFVNVGRLLTGAYAARLGLGFDDVDDLQLAVELVLRSVPPRGERLTLELATDAGRLTAAVGAFDRDLIERRLADEVDGDGLDLRACLERLVDRVELVGEPTSRVVLGKAHAATAA